MSAAHVAKLGEVLGSAFSRRYKFSFEVQALVCVSIQLYSSNALLHVMLEAANISKPDCRIRLSSRI